MDNVTPTTASKQPILPNHPNSQNITGALAIDSSGLPLGHVGDITPEHSGTYSAIAKLASKLNAHDDNNDTTTTSSSSNGVLPTVMIEGEGSAVLIKEYHGRTVVFRVPVGGSGVESNAANDGGEEGKRS